MPRYVLIDAELGEEARALSAVRPEAAARAVDASFGDDIGWEYTVHPPSYSSDGPGYEVYEAGPGDAPGQKVAHVTKSVQRGKAAQPFHIVAARGHVLPLGFAAAMIAAAMITFYAPDAARALRGQPAVFGDHWLATNVIHRGGSITLVNRVKRMRVCSWVWDHTWSNTDTRAIVATERVPGTAVAMTDSEITYAVSIPLPAGLPNGNYQMKAAYIASCDHGDVFTGDRNPARFTVVD